MLLSRVGERVYTIGHPVDYVQTARGCYRPNVCNATGTQCNENAPFANQQVSNFIQRLDAVLPYLPCKYG